MKSTNLKILLNSPETLIMPDAYDPISAKLIEIAGFKAVQCSGYSFSLANCIKQESELSLEKNLEITRQIVDAVNVPVMADAENGYAPAEEIGDTVIKFIRTGAAGMNIEDQIPQNTPPVKIIETKEMVEKIKNARAAADELEPDFIINGRTDALKVSNNRSRDLHAAIKRANLYLKAGADLAFIPYVETLREAEIISQRIKGPVSIAIGLPYNINNLFIDDLKNLGIARISLPTLLVHSSIKVMARALEHAKADTISEFSEKGLVSSKEDLKNIMKHF